MRASPKTLLLLIPFFSGETHARWSEAGDKSEPWVEAAEELADLVIPKLKGEMSETVSLDNSTCPASDPCSTLMSSLERRVVRAGIKFLPEGSREMLRAKIAKEGLYQQSSMMVDEGKAIQLGKQHAIQAFVVVAISQSRDEHRIDVTSINLKSGTVTIRESMRISTKEDTAVSFNFTKGLLWTGIGTGITYASVKASKESAREAEKKYALYKESKDPDSAKKYREETKKADAWTGLYQGCAATGAIIGIYGLFSFFETRPATFYQVEELAEQGRTTLAPEVILNSWSEPKLALSVSTAF